MTSASSNRGAVDLSGFAAGAATAAAQAPAGSAASKGVPTDTAAATTTTAITSAGTTGVVAAPGPAKTSAPGANYVMQARESDFDGLARKSMQHPVVVEFYSPRANAQALSDGLSAMANDAAGRWLLARVNVDADPQIAQALGIQAVPTVVAILAGQLVPLFQGTRDREEIDSVIAEVMTAAVTNGIVGRADPVPASTGQPPASGQAPEAPVVDTRFAAADAALEKGDFATAVAEFDKLLAQAPGDAEAIAGKAQASLLLRTSGIDPLKLDVRLRDASDHDAQMILADLEVLQGRFDAAFTRLVGVVRDTRDEQREAARVRLLDLFEAVGKADPSVMKARRALSSALF